MRRFWGTYVAVAVFGALAAFLWVRAGRPAQPPPESGVALYEAAADDILAIELAPQGVRLERQGPDAPWSLPGQPRARVDQDRAHLLLLAVADLRAERKLADKADEADTAAYGLDQPQHTVRVTLEGGASRVVEVGAAAPVGGLYYARAPGQDAVYTLGEYLVAQIAQTVDDLRDHRVTGFKVEEVRSFVLYRDGQPAISARRAAAAGAAPAAGAPAPARPGSEVTGSWDLDAPWSAPAEGWVAEDLARAWQGLLALRFETDEPSPADLERVGLAKPRLRLDLTIEGRSPLSIMVGTATADDAVYAMSSEGPTVYVAKPAGELDIDPQTLLLTRPLAFERDQLDGVVIVAGELDAAAARSALAAAGAGGAGAAAGPPAGAFVRPAGGRELRLTPTGDQWPADADFALGALSMVRVTGAADAGAIAGDAAVEAVLVEARVKGYSEPYRLLAMKVGDEDAFAVAAGYGVALTLERESLDALFETVTAE